MNLLVIFPLDNNNFSLYFVSLVIGFLFGSIPSGYLAARVKKIDIRTMGSKNIGTTNVMRTLGIAFAIPVFILDFAKGLLPTLFANHFALIPALIGLGAVLGHMFTPWLGFNGGKGVATTIGVMIALAPKALVISMIVFIILLFIFSYVSLASLCFAISLPLAALIFYQGQYLLLVCILIIAALIIIRHRANINRLRTKTESKISLLKYLKGR